MKGFRLSKDKEDLESREVRGFWKAISLANEIASSNEKISLDVILSLHSTLMSEARPDIAGRLRRNGEDIKKLACIEPPPGRTVKEEVYKFWRDFDTRISVIPKHSKNQGSNQRKRWYTQVIDLAAWVQHRMVAIHPFCDGNGRIARLMTNLVLKRFGLPPSRVKYEGEDKKSYLKALCQIDMHEDYEPLKRLIVESIKDAFKKEARIRQSKSTSDH